MKLEYTDTALNALKGIPARVRKASYKQSEFLLQDLHYPSLRVKKYSEAEDRYFKIIGDTYVIEDITPHPK